MIFKGVEWQTLGLIGDKTSTNLGSLSALSAKGSEPN